MAAYIPQRSDLIWLHFDPQAGHEQRGRRPAFVLSPRPYNEKVGLALLCLMTSRHKGYPFEVRLPVGMKIEGVILSDQLKSLDWRVRQAEYIATLEPDIVEDVLKKARLLLS